MATTQSKPELGIDVDKLEAIVETLNKFVADENVLYIKLRNYHWNVVGPHFKSLHILFEEQYTALATSIDELAERVRHLGGNTVGTLQEFVQLSRLTERPGEYPAAEEMVADLLADNETMVRNLREGIEQSADAGEQGTEDLLTGLLQAHLEMAWMLRSTLER